MRAVVQRVRSARVIVGSDTVGEIGLGLLVLLGIKTGDTAEQARWLAEKIVGLRIFSDVAGKMNLDVSEVNGPDIKAENDFGVSKVGVAQRSATAQGRKMTYRFPAHSYTMLKAKLI